MKLVRIEFKVTEEQAAVLANLFPSGISEGVRHTLSRQFPSFRAALPPTQRGTYKRKVKSK